MGKRHSVPAAMSGVQMGLIITPMLDMSFQILSFFVMTYHPSALEGHIDGNLLPPSKVAVSGLKVAKLEEFPAVAEEPELEDALLVILKTVGKAPEKKAEKGDVFADGEPRQVLIKRPAELAPVPVGDDEALFKENLKSLKKELQRIVKEPGQAATNIKIEADGDLKHQYLMQTYDICKQAGYQNVSFVAPARERPAATDKMQP